MSKLLAVEWDGREARVATGRSSGNALVVEQAFTVDLAPATAGETTTESIIGDRIAAALSVRHLGRAEALVGVGRAGIELRVLNVPPAPDEELPGMVRFQAMRQFSGLGEDWPLDFVKLSVAPTGGVTVLAAAILPAMVARIREICQSGELTPKGLILRPFAAAALMRGRSTSSSPCQLLVDLLADEADLTVLIAEQVVFIRTVRLVNGDSEQTNKALVGEIRRTMVAAQNQLGGRRVEQIVLCGSEMDHGALRTQIADALSLPTELFNPFHVVPLSSGLKKNLPEHPGRFAPLLGMLLDEAAGTAHQIDFLNPRRRPAPPDRKRTFQLAGIAAAILVLGMAAMWWLHLKARDDEILQWIEQNNSLQKTHETLQKQQTKAEAIDQWKASDANWLDELRRLSERMPRGEDAIVTSFSAVVRSEGGQVTISGGATDSEVIDDMFRTLSDQRHDVTSKGTGLADGASEFPKAFTKVITVKPIDAGMKADVGTVP